MSLNNNKPSHHRDEWGINTAEYAAGTSAAVAFGCLLCLLFPWLRDLLEMIFGTVLRQESLWWFRWLR